MTNSRFIIAKISFIFLFSTVFFNNNAHSQTFDEEASKFNKVISWINNNYVDTVDAHQLVEHAIIEMLKKLDPHSTYVKEKNVKEVNEPLKGNFDGIGIQFNVLNDTIIVVSPISGGPSEKLGIKAGDRIVKIKNEVVAGIGIDSKGVRDRLLGKKGTKVAVSIKRRNVSELLEFEITRDKIPIFSIDAAYMVNTDIGYIKINRFAATTLNEFHDALTKLKNKNMKHLILDLQDNGGGYLSTAINLTDEFLEDDKLIVYTEGISSPKDDSYATKGGSYENGKMAVLIDEGSASASEILSGAIQDWDRGIIIGRRSFGKGLVQRAFKLPDGSMIRLTIARYYTPTGRSIQKSYTNGEKEYRNDIVNRYNNGELTNKDSIHFPDSLKYYTLLNQRIVYGGGGIMPDIFVPLDTALYSDYHNSLIRKGLFYNFALKYVDDNRKELLIKYPDFDAFNLKFIADNKLFEEFKTYINVKNKKPIKESDKEKTEEDIKKEKEKVEKEVKDFEEAKKTMAINLKALIARSLWTTSEYYQIINEINPIFTKAVEVFEKKSIYKKKLGY